MMAMMMRKTRKEKKQQGEIVVAPTGRYSSQSVLLPLVIALILACTNIEFDSHVFPELRKFSLHT